MGHLFLSWSRACLNSYLLLIVRARALPSVGQYSWAWLDIATSCGKVGIKALREGIKSWCDMHATKIMFLGIIIRVDYY